MNDIRIELEAWRRIGRESDADIFDCAVDRWAQALYLAFSTNGGLAVGSFNQPTPGDMGLLRMLSDKLNAIEPTFTEVQWTKVSDFVTEVLAALKDDTSLPESLRIHIATLVVEVQ